MAGGDGSLGARRAVAIERDLPFVCVPFGTRNHFARDLGPRSGRPAGRAPRLRGERAADRRRPRRRPRLPEQRLARRLRAPRAPARAPSPAPRGARAAALAWRSRCGSRTPSACGVRRPHADRRAVLLVANNALPPRPLLARRARAARRGARCTLYVVERRAAAGPGRSGAARALRDRRRAVAGCARRSTASRSRCRARSSVRDRAARATPARARRRAARPIATSSSGGSSSGANQRSSATSSAARGSPPVTRASQTRFSTHRAPGPSP